MHAHHPRRNAAGKAAKGSRPAETALRNGANDPSSEKPLQPGPQAQEDTIGGLEQWGARRPAGDLAKWTQQRDGAPHSGECRRTRQKSFSLLRMEAGEDFSPIDGTDRQGVASIDEADRATPIKPLYQGNFALAQWAVAVEPDCHLFNHNYRRRF